MAKPQLQELRDELSRQIAFNVGSVPLKQPKGVEEIKLFRIYIDIVRQAESDYLCRNSSIKSRNKAANTLFGIHLSPLPVLCRTLGINCHAARLKILEWKVRGLTGDPVFDFLTKPGACE